LTWFLLCRFDAVDGNYLNRKIVGRNGLTIQQKWAESTTALHGIYMNGFPNFFQVLGPNGPFTNLPPSIETQVEHIGAAIKQAEAHGGIIEPILAAEEAWADTCKMIASYTLFTKQDSWIFGKETGSTAFYGL
jgi:cation diffusion facilitator CzcD-associated flavoprotein CzcO